MITREEIVQKVERLPALPVTVARLCRLTQDESASAADFERVVRSDLTLTTNILRLVNSPFAGLRSEVTTVRQAIAMLGVKRTFEMAVTASMSKVLPERIPGYEVDSEGFWQHCVAVAVLAERLAEVLELTKPDLMFTSALLHDMGKLVIGSYLEGASAEVLTGLKDDGTSLVSVEQSVLGLDHTEAGAEVAGHWGLPGAIVSAARWHHAPGDAPEDVDRTLVDLVHTADALAHTLGFGADIGGLSRRVENDVSERLEVRSEQLERVAFQAVQEILELTQAFCETTPGH